MDPIGQKLLDVAKSQLGYKEGSGGYTKFGDWYGKNIDKSSYFKSAPWCDMFLAWAADQAGVADWAGQFAYTPFHAQWFKKEGAWGTKPEPGAIVFFDWSGTKSLDNIDHVGIVEKVDGSTIHTIEANVDGMHLRRKERTTDSIVGYGYPSKVKVAGKTVESVTSGRSGDAGKAPQPAAQKYVPKHAAPAPAADLIGGGTNGTAAQGVAPREQDTSPVQQVPAFGELLTVVLAGSVALAVGKTALTRIPAGVPAMLPTMLPASSPVRFRKRGRHHRTPVALPVGMTPADLETADASTVAMPAVTAAVAAQAEDREFWSQISRLQEDEDLAFWNSVAEDAEQGAATR